MLVVFCARFTPLFGGVETMKRLKQTNKQKSALAGLRIKLDFLGTLFEKNVLYVDKKKRGGGWGGASCSPCN